MLSQYITLFCGDFNSSSFSNSNLIILIINSLEMCFTLPLVFTVIKLGYTMTYENREAVKTMKQSLQTIWPRYNMHCLFIFFQLLFLHCMIKVLKQMENDLVELRNQLLFNTIFYCVQCLLASSLVLSHSA